MQRKCTEADGFKRPGTSHYWCISCRTNHTTKAKFTRHLVTMANLSR